MALHIIALLATTLFAKQTMLSCEACHTATMGLTALGSVFRIGNQVRGLSASLLALAGTDPQSGIPAAAWAVQDVAGAVVLQVYQYDGRRATGEIGDRFWRLGFGASLYAGRFSANAVTQSGFDSSPNGEGAAAASGAATRVGRNFRFELEDVISHAPEARHTLNAVFGFGFSNASGSQAYEHVIQL
ncbi:MAG TPA: hypothetical protein VFN37_02795 [Candidatus Baltobacteraceae bacterium]|nr:hypothetical protein [Candidatus Baltobacteraceae bacterium]